MGRFGQSVVYGGLFTFWIMCFYFGFSVLSTVFQGGNVAAAAGQSVLVGFVLWFFLSYVIYDLQGWIEERNKPREPDERRNSSDPYNPDNQGGRHIDAP